MAVFLLEYDVLDHDSAAAHPREQADEQQPPQQHPDTSCPPEENQNNID